jgi:hypothetical protein
MTTRRPPASPVELIDWRRATLQAAGFPVGLASGLARDLHTDLHALLALVDRGCPPELAVRILAPLDTQEPWPT